VSKLVNGFGPVPADVMLIGEAPGVEEDAQGKPFVGKSGQILSNALQDAGINREACYVTNIYKYRPPNNRTPTREEIVEHWPMLVDELASVNPKFILLLGNTALTAFAGQGGIQQAHGTRISRQLPGDPFLFCTYHPAATLYRRDVLNDFRNDIATFAKIVSGEYKVPGVG